MSRTVRRIATTTARSPVILLVAFSPGVWSTVSLPLLGRSVGFVLALTLATALARALSK